MDAVVQIATIAVGVITTIGAIVGVLAWGKKSILKDLNEKFYEIKMQFSEVNTRFSEVNTRFSHIDLQLSIINKRLEDLTESLEYIEDDTIAMDRRLVVLETVREEKNNHPAHIPYNPTPKRRTRQRVKAK